MHLSSHARTWFSFAHLALAASLLAGCYAGVAYPEDNYADVPPPAYVATAEPYYYEGHPNYWYHGHWHYREGGRWRRYRSEPEPMRRWRTSRTSPARPAGPPPRPGEELRR